MEVCMSILADLVELMDAASAYQRMVAGLADESRNWEETDVDSRIRSVWEFDKGWEFRTYVIEHVQAHPFRNRIMERITGADSALLGCEDFVSFKLERHPCVKAARKSVEPPAKP